MSKASLVPRRILFLGRVIGGATVGIPGDEERGIEDSRDACAGGANERKVDWRSGSPLPAFLVTADASAKNRPHSTDGLSSRTWRTLIKRRPRSVSSREGSLSTLGGRRLRTFAGCRFRLASV